MKEKLLKNQERYIYKIAHISVSKCPRVPNLVLVNAKTHQVYQMIQYANDLIYSFKNIDETMRNFRKNTGKLRRYSN